MTGSFPVLLSQSYMQAMLYGEDTVSDQFIVEDFKNFLSPYEANTLERILSSPMLEEDDKEFIVYLEDRYGMRMAPNSSDVYNITVQMAHSQLIEMPMHTMGKLKKGMTSGVGEQLWEDVTVEDLNELYHAQAPNPARVASLLTTEVGVELTSEESKGYEFLRRYVRNSDQNRCVDCCEKDSGGLFFVNSIGASPKGTYMWSSCGITTFWV